MIEDAGRKERFRNIRNFALYYGQGREKELSGFDLAVVEPLGQDTQSVKRVQEAGSLVLAYLSVLEIPAWANELRLLNKEDFLQQNGEILINKAYGTYLADLCSPRWRRLLNHRAGSLFYSGYDGLFLDTIGKVESDSLSRSRQDSLMMAAVEFILDLKKTFSNHLIVQNNGLEKLYRLTANLVDGVCWENPPFRKKESAAWVREVTGRLRQLQQKTGLKIFLLLEEKETAAVEMARKAAAENNFILYVAPCGYVGGVNK